MPAAVVPAHPSAASLPSSSSSQPAPDTFTHARKRTLDDTDLTTTWNNASPEKRPKVAFELVPEVRGIEDGGGKSAILIEEEIRHALLSHAQGSSSEYGKIRDLFAPSIDRDGGGDNDDNRRPHRSSAIELRKYLAGFLSNMNLLNRSCADLVGAIIDSEWLALDEQYVRTFTRFLGHLVSSQGAYVAPVLRMLVGNFAHVSASAGRLTHCSSTQRFALHERIHVAIRYITQLLPASIGALSRVLTQQFPHISDTNLAHDQYCRNLLRLTNTVPSLRGHAVDLLADRLIKIDVQVQLDVEHLEEDIEDVLIQGASHPSSQLNDDTTNDDDQLSNADSDIDEDEELDPEESRLREIKALVEKTDLILDGLFEFCTTEHSKPVASGSVPLFDHLLAVFRKTILPTYQSRHTQFLLFHAAQQSPELMSRFIDACTDVLMDKSRSPVIRMSAVAYIASFIARGQKIPPSVVAFAFDTLANYADVLRKGLEPTCQGPDLRRFAPYYATMQALLYVFCFRWRDLLNDPEDYADEDDDELVNSTNLVFLPGVKDTFTQNFSSRLNPLKVCAPEVVSEFAGLAHRLHFMYIYPTLEANKRIFQAQSVVARARDASFTPRQDERYHQLDAYFPFDPYILPRSKRWVQGYYREWQAAEDHQGNVGQEEADSSDEYALDEGVAADERTETPDEA